MVPILVTDTLTVQAVDPTLTQAALVLVPLILATTTPTIQAVDLTLSQATQPVMMTQTMKEALGVFTAAHTSQDRNAHRILENFTALASQSVYGTRECAIGLIAKWRQKLPIASVMIPATQALLEPSRTARTAHMRVLATPTPEPSPVALTWVRTDLQAMADLLLILAAAAATAADPDPRSSLVVRALLAVVQVPMGTAETLRVQVVQSDVSQMAVLRMVRLLVGTLRVASNL